MCIGSKYDFCVLYPQNVKKNNNNKEKVCLLLVKISYKTALEISKFEQCKICQLIQLILLFYQNSLQKKYKDHHKA